MQKYEILHTRLGEMFEMMDCHAIANGCGEKEKKDTRMSFDDAMKLR